MKRFGNMVIGGIQSKILRLILFTVVLLTAAYMAVSVYHSNMLVQLATQSNSRQRAAIEETTGKVMDQAVSLTLSRSNRTEAGIADRMLEDSRNLVTFLGGCVENLFDHPEDYTAKP